MPVILVTSPGASSVAHWSDAAAIDLGGALVSRQVPVEWLRVQNVGVVASPCPPGVEVHDFQRSPVPLWRVSAAGNDVALESALTRLLRPLPGGAVVVHLGLGARGSPNVTWLADRLGARCFAVVRAPEVVCHRGDLVHADGTACGEFEDAVRCRHCCAQSWWRRPHANDLMSRIDMLVGGLMVTEQVFVPSPEHEMPLVRVGVPRAAITVSPTLMPLLECLA